MLQIKSTCENCHKTLLYNSTDAIICTFECAYCKDCVALLKKVCPNCGGGFEKRPLRPLHLLEKFPVSNVIIHHPVDIRAPLQKLDYE
ncbi:DUF1272 domain-containing protein [Winogradskyella forsetii]|uniref:DUF1272 domain-containing protein n=1 Tax=Winogradskyella forsetii TaxID=2686077 RepID=UPI0015B81EEB|nr:DUF1272 domain-containing protein [Winogradskyella forsetii]